MKKFFIFCSIATILLLAGCNFRAETPSPEIVETSTDLIKPIITASAEPVQPSATPTLQPTSTPFPIEHLQPGDPVRLRYIQMFDANSGWAIGGSATGQDHILITSNGGLQWNDISPPERVDLSLGEQKIASGFFLNSQQGWVHYLDSNTIWRTVDQGRGWEPSLALETEINLPYPVVPRPLQFVDTMNGWQMIYEESGMSHDYVTLYSSQDGGLRWEEILSPSDDVGLQSCCKTGFVFIDTLTGLATFGQGPYERPFVEWTVDGGRTWTANQLSLPGDPPTDLPSAYCDVHSPHIFNEATAMIGLECRSGEAGELVTHYFFFTDDLGTTWRSNEYPGGKLIFLDTNIGWATGKEIYITRDGGATWSFVSQVEWDGLYSFIDAGQGWVITLGEENGDLLHTTDGGSTWIMIETEILRNQT